MWLYIEVMPNIYCVIVKKIKGTKPTLLYDFFPHDLCLVLYFHSQMYHVHLLLNVRIYWRNSLSYTVSLWKKGKGTKSTVIYVFFCIFNIDLSFGACTIKMILLIFHKKNTCIKKNKQSPSFWFIQASFVFDLPT
mgnify:CR=1 FL=1